MVSVLIAGATLLMTVPHDQDGQTLSGKSDTVVVQKKFDPSKWKLVWEDDFDKGTQPDPEKWHVDDGNGPNGELQFYTKGRSVNIRQEKGHLILQAHADGFEGHKYTSGRINTRGKKSFLYGRIEARVKLPVGRGAWPAVWLLGESFPEIPWPNCGEIDIMENVGFDPERVHANIHVENYNHIKQTGKGNNVAVNRPWAEFHTFAVEWYRDRMEFFVDDSRYFIYRKESDSLAVWPFAKPHFLILNLAIGGGWAGQKGIDDAAFPMKYEVDYVRYYQEK